ncbi:MAG: hypothetical protein IIA66_02870 [Planctomycetes bacterium]|nr:hypothetical protein [Planctomycetota bacterium]
MADLLAEWSWQRNWRGTGALIRSITVAFDSDGLGALVGPTAPYAIYLEFGTMNMPARPFLLPAFSRMEDQIVKQITVAGGRALRRRGVFIGV